MAYLYTEAFMTGVTPDDCLIKSVLKCVWCVNYIMKSIILPLIIILPPRLILAKKAKEEPCVKRG